jgi:hypothetical protein
MSRVVKAVLVTGGLLAAVGVFLLVAAWRSGDAYELYIRRSARVSQDGHELAGARVFKSSNGHLLLTLPSRRSAPLIYFPEVPQDVGDCNSHTFLDAVVFGLQKHSRDGHYPSREAASKSSHRTSPTLMAR